jgi:hypothetical protein
MHTDANLDRISVFYHGALGGKYVPCAVLFDLYMRSQGQSEFDDDRLVSALARRDQSRLS